jgi:MFS family permease
VSILGGELWRHGDFLRLWSAQAVSAFGARITREGLPLAAVMTLDAEPAQLGVLAALSMGPGLVVGLLAGGFVDRSRRRTILIGADLARFAVLMTVPLAAWLTLLSIEQLYIVAALVGAASVLFDLADNAFLPGLVGPDQLMEGNSKLGVTDSTAEIGGPALAGLLFQGLTAPFAIAVNAATYLASALLLGGIRAAEPPPQASSGPQHPGRDLADGWRAIMARPLVRPLLFMTMAQTLFFSFFAGLYALWALRHLGISPAALGLVIAVGGVGALLGALLAPWMTHLLGIGPAIVVCGVVSGLSAFLIPLAPADPAGAVAFMAAAQLLGDSFGLAAMIPATTLQQTVIPSALLGRTGAIFHIARGGLAVIGALLGGALAGSIGVRETLLVACAGVTLAPAILLASPLWRTREISPPAS